jgi:hypothetical protein
MPQKHALTATHDALILHYHATAEPRNPTPFPWQKPVPEVAQPSCQIYILSPTTSFSFSLSFFSTHPFSLEPHQSDSNIPQQPSNQPTHPHQSRCSDSVSPTPPPPQDPSQSCNSNLTLHHVDDAQQAQQQVYDNDGNPQQPDNQGSLGHEVLAAGAGFMAMRQYQKHEEENGLSPLSPPRLSASHSPTPPPSMQTKALTPTLLTLQVSPKTTP